MKADAMRADFVKEVMGDTSRDVDRQVGDVIDWYVVSFSFPFFLFISSESALLFYFIFDNN